MIINLGVVSIKGSNYSEKRELIYNVLSSTKSHPCAKWVYDNLKDDHPDLSLGTVYRNISLFKETGKIKSVAVINNEERYDADISDHSHFICDKCGAIIDIYDDNHDSIENKLTDENYIIHRKNLVLYGICSKCNNNK